jgi:hypothetical protein
VPLKKEPRREALCQPNERALGEFSRSEIWDEIYQLVDLVAKRRSEYLESGKGYYKSNQII